MKLFFSTVVLWAIIAAVVPAHAYDNAVEKQCLEDYLSYCSAHPHGSAELRYCFEAHRHELRQSCIAALYDAGEIPRKYLNKRDR